jgi:predicted metal-dependent enzyme (double-stranded beta helix superfamily)
MNTSPFECLVADANAVLDHAHDACTITHALCEHVRRALRDPAMLSDCVERAVDALDPAQAKTRFPTIHRDDARRLRIRLFVWPPGFAEAPHRHDHWTVTGVLHNRLRFRTFRADTLQGDALIVDKDIAAGPGDVGLICTPCVHDVVNPTTEPSLSLHLFHKAADDEPSARTAIRPAQPAAPLLKLFARVLLSAPRAGLNAADTLARIPALLRAP